MVLALMVLRVTEGQQVCKVLRLNVTNVSYKQDFSKSLITLHSLTNFELFTPGGNASVNLEMLAEGGLTHNWDVLVTEDTFSNFSKPHFHIGNAIPAGETLTLEVLATTTNQFISMAAKMNQTNDGFAGVHLFKFNVSDDPVLEEFVGYAWDAGTEANDELAKNIIGAPFFGQGYNASRVGGEGFISIHRGIHGIGNLTASVYDWRDPVMILTIESLRPCPSV